MNKTYMSALLDLCLFDVNFDKFLKQYCWMIAVVTGKFLIMCGSEVK